MTKAMQLCKECDTHLTRRDDDICYRCNEKRTADALVNLYASPVRSPFTPGIKVPCQDRPELFFGRGKVRLEAKELCAGCPVRQQCLDWATVNDEQGVWAGTTRDERRELTRQRLTLVA